MGTAVIAIMIIALVALGVKAYTKKLASGCCGANVVKEKRVGPQDKDKAHYPYTYRVGVEGMHCANCAARLENAFHGQEGMWAQADLNKAALLLRAKQRVEEGRIRQIIALAGYRAVSVTEEK